MTTLEAVFVVSSVINVFLLILVFLMYTNLTGLKIHISQLHAGMGSTLYRITSLEQIIAKLAVGFSEFVDMTGVMIEKLDASSTQSDPQSDQMYRTVDGEYTAPSIEKLISKIKNDGVEERYFSDEEMARLKRIFEDADNEIDRLKRLFEDGDDSSDEEE